MRASVREHLSRPTRPHPQDTTHIQQNKCDLLADRSKTHADGVYLCLFMSIYLLVCFVLYSLFTFLYIYIISINTNIECIYIYKYKHKI